jgi:hypothetical protein
MFAGRELVQQVTNNLNSIQNVMNMEHNAHVRFDNLWWGIQCVEEGGKVPY